MDEFTEVEHVGYGSSIMESIKGVLIGVLLFVTSFVVLWKTEGCEDMSKAAKKSVVVDSGKLDKSADGKLVSVTGPLKTTERVSDTRFFRGGQFIKLQRRVEIFAWKETKKTETKKELGGSKKRITRYSYTTIWQTSAPDSSKFRRREGHHNPEKRVKDRTFTPEVAKIGVYRIDPRKMGLPPLEPVTLKKDLVMLSDSARLAGQYIFIGAGTPEHPNVGDVRLSFHAVKNGLKVTAFAQLKGDTLVAYKHKEEHTLYRAVKGERKDALSQMKSEHNSMLWAGRICGFLMMWIGLSLFFGPINAVLDVVPFLGDLGRMLISIAMFVVALVLSAVTTLIAIIAHNVYLLIGVIVLLFGGLLVLRLIRGKSHA